MVDISIGEVVRVMAITAINVVVNRVGMYSSICYAACSGGNVITIVACNT